MIFNSIHFLIFFPIVVLLYYIIPDKWRWIWLLISSYYFYMSWNPKYMLLIAVSTVVTYISGVAISYIRSKDMGQREALQKTGGRLSGIKLCQLVVAISFIVNLSILFFFKYFKFALLNLNHIFSLVGINTSSLSFDIVLPVGISFYTFQALSYTADVYREKTIVEKNIFKYALFVSFFPQLVAGPIERAGGLISQIHEKHHFDYERVKRGLLLMLWGYFEKILIADRLALIVDKVYTDYEHYSGIALIFTIICFAIQIYCDFSGYSDIARGAALVLGFRLRENFKQPYFSTSIKEFWRKWHISLSEWFRDYCYIPLGGSRCSRLKRYCNLMITFLLSGLWHGASWHYVLWGGIHGAYQIIGEVIEPFHKKIFKLMKVKTDCFSYRLLHGIVTFILVSLAWIFFRAKSCSDAFSILVRIFVNFGSQNSVTALLNIVGFSTFDIIFLMICVYILLTMDIIRRRYNIIDFLEEQNIWFSWSFYGLAVFGVLFGVILYANVSPQSFIYFQF